MSKVYKDYATWCLAVRLFHWVNVVAVICLIFVGLVMLYHKELGISSMEAKISLKELHVIIGYIFVTNLIIRMVFAFIGPASARFNKFIPGKGFMESLKSYRESLKSGEIQQFTGHNPLGKLAVNALFLLLIILSVSGLIRAGTDIYYPPFGSAVTSYIVADGSDPASLIPYQKEGVNAEKMASLKAFKSPVGKIHLYTAYLLMFLIILHITSVVRAEIKEKDPLVSSMISGHKLISGKPEDE